MLRNVNKHNGEKIDEVKNNERQRSKEN